MSLYHEVHELLNLKFYQPKTHKLEIKLIDTFGHKNKRIYKKDIFPLMFEYPEVCRRVLKENLIHENRNT